MKTSLSKADLIAAAYAIAKFIKFIFSMSSCCLESFIKCLDGWNRSLTRIFITVTFYTLWFPLSHTPTSLYFRLRVGVQRKEQKRNYFLDIPKKKKKKDTAVQTEAKINSSFHSCLQLAVNLYIIP